MATSPLKLSIDNFLMTTVLFTVFAMIMGTACGIAAADEPPCTCVSVSTGPSAPTLTSGITVNPTVEGDAYPIDTSFTFESSSSDEDTITTQCAEVITESISASPATIKWIITWPGGGIATEEGNSASWSPPSDLFQNIPPNQCTATVSVTAIPTDGTPDPNCEGACDSCQNVDGDGSGASISVTIRRPVSANVAVVYNYPETFSIDDSNLVEITEDGEAIYAGDAHFLVVAYTDDACEPLPLIVNTSRDGNVISSEQQSLSPGQVLELPVAVNFGDASSVTVVAAVLDPFTQAALAEGEENEDADESSLDLSPFSKALHEYAPKEDIHNWSKSLTRSGIKSIIDLQFTDAVRDSHASNYGISRTEVDANIADFIDGAVGIMEPQRQEGIDKLFDVIKPLYKIKAGKNDPGSNIAKQVLDVELGKKIADGLRRAWDPVKPIAEQLPDFISYTPPSAGDALDNLSPPIMSGIMSGNFDNILDALEDVPLAQKVGIKIPILTTNTNGELFLEVLKPTAGGGIEGWQYGGKLDFTLHEEDYDFTVNVHGKKVEGIGPTPDSFEAGIHLILER